MKKLINLKLPEFAFLEGSWHEQPNLLEKRNVIIHLRSASVMEVFEQENVFFNEGTLAYKYRYVNKYGIKEHMVIALHYSATLDKDADRQFIIDNVLKPAAKWFCDYTSWEDEQIHIFEGD